MKIITVTNQKGGAGKTTTLRAVSNLLKAERGDVTKGSIDFRGERIDRLTGLRTLRERRSRLVDPIDEIKVMKEMPSL